MQYKNWALSVFTCSVGSLQHGHFLGTWTILFNLSTVSSSLALRLSTILGIIWLALVTPISSPIASFNLLKIDKLWTVALFTVVPYNSTSLKVATGVITPVLPTCQLTSNSVVVSTSSANLKAKECNGWWEVLPKDNP